MIGKVAFEYNLPVLWRKPHAYYTSEGIVCKAVDRRLSGRKENTGKISEDVCALLDKEYTWKLDL